MADRLVKPLPDRRRGLLVRRIKLFVTLTISYNVIEAVVALAEGTRASSTALIGFGLDSVIEVSSAAAVAWQFAGPDPAARERIALRVIACSFFGLAAYVTIDAVRALLGVEKLGIRPSASCWPRSAWSSCRCSPSRNAERAANSGRYRR